MVSRYLNWIELSSASIGVRAGGHYLLPCIGRALKVPHTLRRALKFRVKVISSLDEGCGGCTKYGCFL